MSLLWAGAFHSSVLALHLVSSLHKLLLFVRKLPIISHFQDCLQNADSGAPHGQLSTFGLECVFLYKWYKLYQRTATSTTVSKMSLLEPHMASSGLWLLSSR